MKFFVFTSCLVISLFLFFSCENMDISGNEEGYSIAIKPIIDIGRTTATCGGIITANDHYTFKEVGVIVGYKYGIDYYQNQGVFKSDTISNDFNCKLTGLLSNTKYYIKAYAINSKDGTIIYGDELVGQAEVANFTTLFGDYKLECISGDKQKYIGGGTPDPMVFKIKNLTDGGYLKNLIYEQYLTLESVAPNGKDDGTVHYELSDGTYEYHMSYYSDPLLEYNKEKDEWIYLIQPYVLYITVNLKSKSTNHILASYKITHFIEKTW